MGKNLGEMLVRNPNSCVPNPNADNAAAIALGGFCGDGERPAAGHGLNPVEQDVEERLLHLPRIGGDVRQIGGQAFLDLDMKLLGVGPYQREHRADECVHVAGRDLRIAEPRKFEKIVQRAVEPCDLAMNLGDDFGPLAVEVVLFR